VPDSFPSKSLNAKNLEQQATGRLWPTAGAGDRPLCGCQTRRARSELKAALEKFDRPL